MNSEHKDQGLDRQIRSLAGSLREQGTAPGRDLWPEIEAAIGNVEKSAALSRRSTRPALWRVAALAASLVLMVGLGYLGNFGGDANHDYYRAGQLESLDLAAAPVGMTVDPASLHGLDQTLQDLNSALSADPNNGKLSRLVGLVHKSRAEVMRRDAGQWQR